MKKLLSLVLAAMLCLCALTPAMAETAVETFPYTLENYAAYFNYLALSMFGVEPEWAADYETGAAVASVPGYGEVIFGMDANQNVNEIMTIVSMDMNDTAAVQTKSNAFGQIVALAALSSKAAEDINSFTEDKINTVTNELVAMINEMMGKIADALTGNMVSNQKEIDGNLCTFFMQIDATAMTLSFGFMMEP